MACEGITMLGLFVFRISQQDQALSTALLALVLGGALHMGYL
jgi:lipoprotein signal peptidase